jgi:hypothetical protein
MEVHSVDPLVPELASKRPSARAVTGTHFASLHAKMLANKKGVVSTAMEKPFASCLVQTLVNKKQTV